MNAALLTRASALWPAALPHARRNRARWLRAIRWMRRQQPSIWLLDEDSPKPGWFAVSE